MFVESLSNNSLDEAFVFLKKHDTTTLFLMGNLEAFGPKKQEHPNSGNFKWIKEKDQIVAIFCLCNRGSLLIESETEAIFPLVLEACREENIPITALMGAWNFCSALWSYFKKEGAVKEKAASKEILYEVAPLQAYSSSARLLQEKDFEQWKILKKECSRETSVPLVKSEAVLLDEFTTLMRKKMIWGHFSEWRLVSIANLNSTFEHLGQVGGVYTIPEYRGQGHSKEVMKQLVSDSKNILGISKLIIFTDESNIPAQRVYLSLEAREIGYYALLFG